MTSYDFLILPNTSYEFLALRALKRLGRYRVGHRRLVFQYPWQTIDRIDAYSDTDWSGCPKTRKSTSGGCCVLGGHFIKSWSPTQTSVLLISGESQFYGVVKAGGVSLGYQALLGDLGLNLPVQLQRRMQLAWSCLPGAWSKKRPYCVKIKPHLDIPS